MTHILRTITNVFPALQWRQAAVAFPVLLACVLGLQAWSGAYRNESGGHPDEAGHYVTGLMVRDYLASGCSSHPMRFARNYYEHYPKVALGHWPPGFYLVQAAWSLLFTPWRTSMLVMMAVLAALLALVTHQVLAAALGQPAAWAGALLLLATPIVVQYTGMIMTEVPVALLALLATLCFARFIEHGRAAYATAFALLAAAAILTKGSGLFLAAVPPIAVLLTRRFDLVKRPAFWAAAAIVALLTGPWTVLTLHLVRDGWEDTGTWPQFVRAAVPYYSAGLWKTIGTAVLVAAAIGLAVRLRAAWRREPGSATWAALAGLLAGVLLLHVVVPCGFERRHLLPLLPPLVMFALAGVAAVAAWRPTGATQPATRDSRPATRETCVPLPRLAAVLALVVAGFALETCRWHDTGCRGFAPVAQQLLADPALAQARCLISSDAVGEGMFISELAMRENRPGHVIRRASKLFASSTWRGSAYEARITAPAQLLALLEKEQIAVVVTDAAIPPHKRAPHHQLLADTIAAHPTAFRALGTFAATRANTTTPAAIHAYRVE